MGLDQFINRKRWIVGWLSSCLICWDSLPVCCCAWTDCCTSEHCCISEHCCPSSGDGTDVGVANTSDGTLPESGCHKQYGHKQCGHKQCGHKQYGHDQCGPPMQLEKAEPAKCCPCCRPLEMPDNPDEVQSDSKPPGKSCPCKGCYNPVQAATIILDQARFAPVDCDLLCIPGYQLPRLNRLPIVRSEILWPLLAQSVTDRLAWLSTWLK